MISSISNYGGLIQQQSLNRQLQAQLATLGAEAQTGTYQNPATQLGPQMTLLYNLQNQSAQKTAVQTAATSVGTRLDTMQTALTNISTVVQSATTDAIAAQDQAAQNATGFTTAANQSQGAMDQMLSMLNTSYNGQFVFSGQDSGTPSVAASSTAANGPIPTLQTMLSSAVSTNGGPLDANSVATFESSVDSMFDDTNANTAQRFSGVFFSASDNGKPVSFSVGGSQTMSYDMKANSQAFRNIFKGLSLMAMVNAPSSQLDDGAKQALIAKATSALTAGQSALTNDTAGLGSKQAQLQTITDTQQAAATAAQAQLSTLDSVDPYKTATQLTALQTQLQASYAITSMISKLSYVNYMN